MTVIESNACRVPVVAANSPGLRDSVVDGETGTLYDYGNLNQLADAVIDLIQNKDKRSQYESSALTWAQKWNWDESAAKAILIIENIIQT